MNAEELTGAQLDYWVAEIEGITGLVEKDGRMCHVREWDPEGFAWRDSMKDWVMWVDYAPSQRWDHAGPIIERERISIVQDCISAKAYTELELGRDGNNYEWAAAGETPLIAAMRVFVASKFGSHDPTKRHS